MNVFYAKHRNSAIVNQSSSGGMFYTLASYVIQQHGIVFGAKFDNNFNVIMDYSDDDISPFMGSKYVKASNGDSFAKCKQFLEDNRVVLYSGTPCQIVGLKAFLKREYDNLIAVDVICHGTPLPQIWQQYLKSFGKSIQSIQFRDKRVSWPEYHLTIKFADGTEYSKNHNDDTYMKLFLTDKTLCIPCYKCKHNKDSAADITIGDAWGISSNNNELNNNRGTNVVIVRTDKGAHVLNDVSTNIITEPTPSNYLSTLVGYEHSIVFPKNRAEIIRKNCEPRIAMVTIPGHANVGNTLQSFALQSIVQSLMPSASITLINDVNTNDSKLSFYRNYVQSTPSKFDSSKYDVLLVGSDQIWGTSIPKDWHIPIEDQFAMYPNIKKIFYAPSFGFIDSIYTGDIAKRIANSLSRNAFISSRELYGVNMIRKMFGASSVPVIDPTMLFDSDFYIKYASSTQREPRGNHVFIYVLDNNNDIQERIRSITTQLNASILSFDGSVEQFIENMKTANYVITDSYHGTVFALLFNKPFIAIKNAKRGALRFDDLAIRFNCHNRIVTTLDQRQSHLLLSPPNANEAIQWYRKSSIQFLTSALYSLIT